jgi:peptidoglycan-associated lipoprotein
MTCLESAIGVGHLRLLRLMGFGLFGMLAACQRPTQLLPPAPIFDMQTSQASGAQQDRDAFAPSLRDDEGIATSGDFERFAGIKRVYFERNSAELTGEARRTLDQQAEWLRQHPDVRASLQGHADAFGTREHQVALGERRASAMKFYLTARGVAADRLSITSFGKQQPATLGWEEANQKTNRRGEAVLIGAPGASGN